MDPDMSIPVPSMLFGLGGKCILNWALILFQKNHIWRSFVCVFSLSLAVIDTALTLVVTFVDLQGNSNILGWRLTRYHVCLLVEILGFVYSAQHLSVLVITALEHFYAVIPKLQCKLWRPTWIFHLFLTILTWFFSIFFVFKLANVQPYLDDVAYFQIYHCWTLSSSVISELAIIVSCLCLCWILYHSLRYFIQVVKNPDSNQILTLKSQIRVKLMFIVKVFKVFNKTWGLFLIFLLLQAVIPLNMPSHLGLNCAWLCFLNSLFIAAALCVVSPASELAQGLAALPPDSFCDWMAEFSSETHSRNKSAVRERRL